MKKFVFALTLIPLFALCVSPVQAADVVGNESYEVCWRGIAHADNYQLFFGQTNTGKKESTVYEGLDFRSRCVTLRHLKPCTTYSWNLMTLRDGKSDWQWGSDQTFATQGICPVPETGKIGTQVTAHTGKKLTVVGNASATTTWSVVHGAEHYTVYYGAKKGGPYEHSAIVTSKANSLKVNYLNPGVTYYYRVAAYVNRKEVWEGEKTLRSAQVLGATTQNVLGAKVVGNESYTVSWHGTASAEAYQIWYGQADKGVKDSTLYEGLDNRSKSVTLYQLKPCTRYIWNLHRNDESQWKWQWETDQSFTTGGVCEKVERAVVGGQITTSTGKKTTVTGLTSKTVSWPVILSADYYTVYYKEAGAKGFTHSVRIPREGTSVTINYLNPGITYMYQVAAKVGNIEVWQSEQRLK